jgi:phage terminase large subunit-like protein
VSEREELKDKLQRARQAVDAARHNRLALYSPYEKQKEFHAAGARARERNFSAGNQLGKTLAGSHEMAMHLTGRYPDWWAGRKFLRPIRAWVGAETGPLVRDGAQRLLMGQRGQYGTGAIPKRDIHQTSMSRGVADLLDNVVVKHASGGLSYLGFKSYEQGRENWQADTLHVVWYDEEPPPDIYSEGTARITSTGGLEYVTATPLRGLGEVQSRFHGEQHPDRALITMTIDDALHIPAEERARIIAGYPEHEREARTKGIPMLGSGRVFPLPESAIVCEPFAVPDHFACIVGMDFGWDHPTAAAWLAWDRDRDVIYVTDAYRAKEQTPIIHAAAIKGRGEFIPVAWPHDGLQHDKGSGEQLAEIYRKIGLKMLHDRATFTDGSNGVEAGVMEMLTRMQTGRLKVFSHLGEWFEEFRLYHRKDGRIVKLRDDLLSATRYGVMMRREARNWGDCQENRSRLRVINPEGSGYSL